MLQKLKAKLASMNVPRIAVVKLHGVISTSEKHVNSENHGPLIEQAFDFVKPHGKRPAGYVILDVDSRGGSPVQSALIGDLIVRRAAETGVKTFAVVGDMGASGGYWIAAAADKILANRMSILGSIGVIGGGFGFQDLIAKIGVERRVFTAGKSKSKLDPFKPLDPEDEKFINDLLTETHSIFKRWVEERRGSRLRPEGKDLFDGSVWHGEAALANGIVDRLGDVPSLIKELSGDDDPKVKFLSPQKKGLFRLVRGLRGGEASVDEFAETLAQAFVETAARSGFSLRT